jgi:hypothetical protein
MPEADIIGRIDAQIAIIAPAPARMALEAAAIGHYSFALAEVT